MAFLYSVINYSISLPLHRSLSCKQPLHQFARVTPAREARNSTHPQAPKSSINLWLMYVSIRAHLGLSESMRSEGAGASPEEGPTGTASHFRFRTLVQNFECGGHCLAARERLDRLDANRRLYNLVSLQGAFGGHSWPSREGEVGPTGRE